MFGLTRRFLSVFVLLVLGGCVSVADINHYSRKIENVWLLEYQKQEDSHRTRVIESGADDVYFEVRKTLVDLNLPVISSDMKTGEIVAQGIAPAPLTQDEWLRVVEIEEPRVKKLSEGWMFISEDPSDYVLTVKVTIRGGTTKSIVVLDYSLAAPRYESMGFKLPSVAPPEAVLIGSLKFWDALSERLMKASKPMPRMRKPEEMSV